MVHPPSYLLPWLTYSDYLTLHLRSKSGDTALEVLAQQWMDASAWDQDRLHLAPELVLHRDIVVLAWGAPCWFARTILPRTTYNADLALFGRLQQEPLGNLIFQGTTIQRVNLRHYPIYPASPEYAWLTEAMHQLSPILWARLSTFQLKSMELFGFDRRSEDVVPSVARNLLPNQGDPSSQAPQDDVHERNSGQGHLFYLIEILLSGLERYCE